MSRRLSFFLLALCALAALAATEEIYSDKYDYINIEEILANPGIRARYYNCFLETGPCQTPDAKFFKEKFPEALVTKCRKCTEKQKVSFQKIVEYYTEKEPEKWKMVLTKAINDAQKKRSI
uniref:Chemosensory protein n=1 Tax=Phenacoccus solenopsis TaxID=483260 RepID=A0A0C5K7Z9_9HEMI|nr:chemosensory protein [Phenacoccus solenopsis]